MNKENNQRFQNTEEKIIAAYGTLAARKDSDKITVSDICREANIHRTTFYGHFLDIRNLRECASKNHLQHLIESVSQKDGANYREMILQELLFCYRHRKIMKRTFQSENLEFSAFFPSVLNTAARFSEDSQTSLQNGSSKQKEAEQDYFNTFIHAGFMAILRKWILADCPETPEELSEIICKFICDL